MLNRLSHPGAPPTFSLWARTIVISDLSTTEGTLQIELIELEAQPRSFPPKPSLPRCENQGSGTQSHSRQVAELVQEPTLLVSQRGSEHLLLSSSPAVALDRPSDLRWLKGITAPWQAWMMRGGDGREGQCQVVHSGDWLFGPAV